MIAEKSVFGIDHAQKESGVLMNSFQQGVR